MVKTKFRTMFQKCSVGAVVSLCVGIALCTHASVASAQYFNSGDNHAVGGGGGLMSGPQSGSSHPYSQGGGLIEGSRGFGGGNPYYSNGSLVDSATDVNSHGGAEPTPADRITQLTALKAQLEEMKTKLQGLLDSLKQGGTLPLKQNCPLIAMPVDGTATTTLKGARHCRPFIHRPILCPEAAQSAGSFGGGTSTNTPMCRPGHSTSTPFMSNCVNNDPRRCTDMFGGSTSTVWNTLPPYVSSPRYGTPSTTTSGGVGPSGDHPGSSYGGGNLFGGGGSSFNGQVRGASSDMSAEMADTLDSLKGDLLDISDALEQ